MVKTLLTVATSLLLSTAPAIASDDNIVDDGSSFVFFVEGTREAYGELHYSGHRTWFERGVERQDWRAPDCLILGGNFEPLEAAKAEPFLSGLDVRDDAYGVSSGVKLQWELRDGNYVYFLAGISRYIDGIKVATTDPGKTFYSLMTESFGERQGNLALVLSRGCRALQP